jgi:tetratricopeptide (TPR) repeat protein
MPRDRRWMAAALCAVVVAGCRHGDGAARAAAGVGPPIGSAPPVAGSLTGGEAKEVCLADPGGSDPVDRALRAVQQRTRNRSSKSDEWVAIGREWVRKARVSFDPGFYVNVEACAATALSIEADYAPALTLRSLALMNDHKFDEARKVAEEVLKREPDDPVALGTLSDALLELGRYREAAEAAQRQLGLRPGMAAYSRGSYIRWLHGDERRAKMLIRDALYGRDARDAEPAAWTFVEAANLFWQLGDYQGSDAVYAEALRWVPDYPAALVGRARIAIAEDQPRLAIAQLDKAYRLRPLPETAWLMGDAHEALGESAAARQAYDRVVQQGRRGDKLTLALFYATKDRDHEEALRLIDEERTSRGGIHVDDVYAWVSYRIGRLREAREASDRAVRLGTKEARLLYHAGAIHLATGDPASGRALVRRALELNPHFDWTGATEARRLLETQPRTVAANEIR